MENVGSVPLARVLAVVLAIAAGSCGRHEPSPIGEKQHTGVNGVTTVIDRATGYSDETLERFRLLLNSEEWIPGAPPRNKSGLLQAVHRKTLVSFILVPDGEFEMGSREEEEGRQVHEGPVRKVRVRAFLMARTECAQSEWDRIRVEDLRIWRGPSLPIHGVAWDSAQDWILRAGGGVRLPSEAEWEYCCKAGEAIGEAGWTGRTRLDRMAWYKANSGGRVRKVATKAPNSWGFFDMLGNVYEWCQDSWLQSYEGAPLHGNPRIDRDSRSARVIRGGGYGNESSYCRPASRFHLRPDEKFGIVGFRLAADLPSGGSIDK